VRGYMIGILCIFIGQSAAYADEYWQAKAMLQGIGLDGRWANDCNKAAAADNAMLVYSTPDNGPPTERFRGDLADERTVELLDVRHLANDDLHWVIAEGDVMLTVVTQLKDDRLRTWSSSSGDGRYRVKDGKMADGKASPWFNKCETN